MARMSQGHEGGKTLRLSILDQFQNLIQGNTSIQKEVRTDFYTLQARLKRQIQFIGMIGNDPDDPVQWKVLLHILNSIAWFIFKSRNCLFEDHFGRMAVS